jgi:transcriptional regulator with XRE-family HTH domain
MTKKATQELIFIKQCLMRKNLKILLHQKGIEIATMARETKISRQTFYNWIKGTKYPTDEAAIAVAKYLGILKPSHIELLALIKKLHALEKKIERLGK